MLKINISLNNKSFYISHILLFLILIKNISSFCLNSKKLENPFPDLSDSEQFYLKKLSNGYFVVGNETSATSFSLPNLEVDPYQIDYVNQINYPYLAYSDSFHNMDPIVVGGESPYIIKYIVTENEIDNSQALYDANDNELREGKLSFGYSDFKILEPLNEREYIGAIKIEDSINSKYSIKLQIMSFTQKLNGYIKQLSGKEYAHTTKAEQTVNNIYFIESLKKILIIRTIVDEIYFDFIDYDNYFGTLQISKKIKAPFDVKEYRFKSTVIEKEGKNTYIASCFRKLNFLYCYSGYYDEEKIDFTIIQEQPKLVLSTCTEKIYKNIALYKLKTGIGIVGCYGNPSYAIRFNKALDIIGTYIKFPKPYSEFVVVNSSTLFVMYSQKNAVNEYDLYGCIYHLPICHTPEKYFLKQGEKFNFQLLKNGQEDLEFMDDIYIQYKIFSSGKFVKDDDDDNSITNDDASHYKKVNNLYYINSEINNSFEEIIYYYSVVKKDTTLGDDEEARSQECILSIVNCYKSCKECDDIGDINNNNCEKCENDYYFIEDKTSKQCLKDNGDLEKYYFDDSEDVFKRCYTSCKKCKKGKNGNLHNCLVCDDDNNYFPHIKYSVGSESFYDCYLDTQPPPGNYFDNSITEGDNFFKPCSPERPNCKTCIKKNEEIYCIKCFTENRFYAFFEDDSKKNARCTNTIPDTGYYLDIKAGEYKKCYPSCETCFGTGSDEFNNCITCKTDSNDFGVNSYVVDSSTCKCKYNFYYKIESNQKIFTCTENEQCPNEVDNKYPYLIINSQNIRQCISNCPPDYPYIYNNQCYSHIPNGTSIMDDSSNNCEDNRILTYDQCIINDYIKSTIPLSEISKAEKDYVYNYKTQYSNTADNKDYTYNHVNLVRNNNDEYILLIFENEKCIEKFTSEYGLGYTDLTDYTPKIKTENGIGANEPIIYSYLYSYKDPLDSDGISPENLTFNCYNSDSGEQLNLEFLNGENITQYVPAPPGEDLQKLNYLSKYSDLGIDFSDPNSDFFNSQCFIFTSDSGKDVTLADRRKYFFNNLRICEDNCVFSGIDKAKNSAMCRCPYKSGTSGGGQTTIKGVTFPDYDEDYFIFDMWKCLSNKMVEGKELKKSYITIIVFCILLLTILFTFLYFYCNKNKFQFMSKISNKYSSVKSSQSVTQKKISIEQNKIKSNPPRKEGESDTDSNLMKEKGYVHNVKRPFNYDNNNLFFHADEHYTIGNNNLNSLFMGQNFKNDYTENMEQLNNDDKKPKQVINNYNTINIPGKKINKNKFKNIPKINNFNNINKGPDIISINNSNTGPSVNKGNRGRNNPKIIKNDQSDLDSFDPLRNEKKSLKGKSPGFKNKIKPDDSSEKSYTNFSNKRSLISNKNNSLNGKFPEPEKEKDDELDEDIKNACNEMGEQTMKINKADYDTAKQTDMRDFCTFYFNQLKHRQIFLYTTYFHKYAENIFMKIMIIIFHILLCLFLNLFWYRTYYVHSEFISPITNHSTFSSKYAWFRILLSVLFYIIIVSLLHLIYLPQLRIYYALSDDKLDKNQKIKIMEDNIKCMKINYIIFIVINFCFMIVLLLYVLVFSYVFQNSKTDLMISFILTVVITQALPFLFVLLVTILRFIGLKYNYPSVYKFSLFFTI